MKKAIIAITLLFTTNALAGTRISDTLSVSKYVKPDIYVVPINVKMKSWDESKILSSLSILDQKVKALNLPYEGGNFRIEENRVWDTIKKRYVTDGYIGTIHYTFKLKNVENQNQIFNLLNEESRDLGFQYTVGSPHWEVSVRKREKIKKSLKREVIKKALKEAKVFGKELNSFCTVESISFSSFIPVLPLWRSNVESLSAPQSARTPKTISVKADVKFNCFKRKK